MARAIDNQFIEGALGPDGRRSVQQICTLDDGRVLKYDFLAGPETNLDFVREERFRVIDAELAARDEARQLVVGSEVPHTKHEFLSLFTPVERIAIRARAKTNDTVLDFREMLDASGGVYKSLARPGLQYLASLGDLTPERAAEIEAKL